MKKHSKFSLIAIISLSLPFAVAKLWAQTKEVQQPAPQPKVLPVAPVFLQKWLKALDRKEGPSAFGKVQSLTQQPISGIIWHRASVDTLHFGAQLYGAGGDCLTALPYSFPDEEPPLPHSELLYVKNKGVIARSPLYNNCGQVQLVEGSNVPSIRCINFLDGKATAPSTKRLSSQFLAITPQKDGKLKTSKVVIKQSPSYLQVPDPAKENLAVIQTDSGLRLPPIADFSWAGTESSELPISFYADVRKVANEVVVGGEQGLGEHRQDGKRGMELFWHTLSGGEWKSYYKPLPPTVLRDLLPSFWGDVRLNRSDIPVIVKVWKDGGLVLRLYGDITDGSHVLRCIALIYQPREGKPKLLVWSVKHEKNFGPHGVDLNKATSLEIKQKTFNRVWFPQDDGTVASELSTTGWTNDLIFDVDVEHNTLIYLLNGRLWSLDLANLSL